MCYVRGDADHRSIDPYVQGLRSVGVQHLESRVVANAGEFLPIEAPHAFVDLVREFARRVGVIQPTSPARSNRESL